MDCIKIERVIVRKKLSNKRFWPLVEVILVGESLNCGERFPSVSLLDSDVDDVLLGRNRVLVLLVESVKIVENRSHSRLLLNGET